MTFKPCITARSSAHGFTLIELMFALAISSVLSMAVYQLLTWQNQAYFVEDQVIEMQQNTRSALNQLVTEIRMGGHHAMGEALTSNLTAWVEPKAIPTYPMPVTLDANPKITLGPDNNPDIITFLSVLNTNNNPTTTASAINPGDTAITLSLSASRTGSQYKSGDIIHLGSASEYARVTAISDNTLHFDTNPHISGNQGVLYGYGAGEGVGEISVVSYTVFNENNDPNHHYHTKNRPVLKRKVNKGGFQPVAESITDLSMATTAPGVIEMVLTGKTAKPSPGNTRVGQYKTFSIKTVVKVRNSNRIGMGTDCALAPAPAGFRIVDGFTAGLPCTISLEWNGVTGNTGQETSKGECRVTGYRIYYDHIPGIHGFSIDIRNTTAHLLDVSSLDACGVYTAVSAINSAGVSAKSAERFLTDTTAPETPSGLSARGSQGNNQIVLSWRKNHDCDLAGYVIHRSTKKGGPYSSQVNALPLPRSSTSHTDTGLIGCKTYYYVMTAVDHCSNESDFSLETSADTIDTIAPLPPTGIRKSSSNSANTLLTWSLSGDDSAGYNDVAFYKVYGDGILLGETDAGNNALTFPTRPGITLYSVSAVDNCSNESLSTLEDDCTETPVITIDSPCPGRILAGNTLITGTASAPENKTLTSIEVKMDDGGWNQATGSTAWMHPLEPKEFSEGIHIITARATDNTGCTATASTSIIVENPDGEMQQLSCKSFLCWTGDTHRILMMVYAHDQNHHPVPGANVFADISTQEFTDFGDGWYGGNHPDDCGMTDMLWAESHETYKITDLPISITITVETPWSLCRSSTTLHGAIVPDLMDTELKTLLSLKKE